MILHAIPQNRVPNKAKNGDVFFVHDINYVNADVTIVIKVNIADHRAKDNLIFALSSKNKSSALLVFSSCYICKNGILCTWIDNVPSDGQLGSRQVRVSSGSMYMGIST